MQMRAHKYNLNTYTIDMWPVAEFWLPMHWRGKIVANFSWVYGFGQIWPLKLIL